MRSVGMGDQQVLQLKLLPAQDIGHFAAGSCYIDGGGLVMVDEQVLIPVAARRIKLPEGEAVLAPVPHDDDSLLELPRYLEEMDEFDFTVFIQSQAE